MTNSDRQPTVNWGKLIKVLFAGLGVIVLAYLLMYFLSGAGVFFPTGRRGTADMPAPYSMEDYGIESQALGQGLSSRAALLPPLSKSVSRQPRQQNNTGANRKIIQGAELNAVVKDVRQAIEQIRQYTVARGGFVVSSRIYQPYSQSTGSLTVRVPATELASTLAYLRSLAIKVTDEQVHERDVTDQYMDLDYRISRLRSTKARLEQIMNQTEDVDQILSIQKQIFRVQDDLDRLIGQKNYLDQTISLSVVRINLSTDEYALPYSPDEPFRPLVTLKLAVRSLMRTLRALANLAIWLLVYSVILVPAWWFKRFVWPRLPVRRFTL